MSKRSRVVPPDALLSKDALETNVFPVPPDPLKSVPRSLSDLAQAKNFTVCDLIVVLDEMAKLFKTSISMIGPSEGSIHLVDIPPASWISDKKKSEYSCNGSYTELRFDFSTPYEELKFIQDTLYLCSFCRNNPNIMTTIVRSCDEDADTIRTRIFWGNWGKIYDYDDKQVADLLCRPMPLNLRTYYPTYTWPRWAFGAFEAFIARRIQLK